MPNTIAQNLQRLQTARTDIANAITTMGGTVTSGDGFEEFAADIVTIPVGGDIQFSHESCSVSNTSSHTSTSAVGIYDPSSCGISGASSSYAFNLEIPIITTSSNIFICIPVYISLISSARTASVSYSIPSSYPSRYGYKANTMTLHSYSNFVMGGTGSCTVNASTFNFSVSNASSYNMFGDFILKFDKT